MLTLTHMFLFIGIFVASLYSTLVYGPLTTAGVVGVGVMIASVFGGIVSLQLMVLFDHEDASSPHPGDENHSA